MFHTPHPATCSCAEHPSSRCRGGDRSQTPEERLRGDLAAAGAPAVPPPSHKSPGREGGKGGARTQPVHRAGTIPYIFVKAFASQSFPPIFILWGLISLVLLRVSAFSRWFNPRCAGAGARSSPCHTCPMQHPALPGLRGGLAEPCRTWGRDTGGKGRRDPSPRAPGRGISALRGVRARRGSGGRGCTARVRRAAVSINPVIEEKEEREGDTP